MHRRAIDFIASIREIAMDALSAVHSMASTVVRGGVQGFASTWGHGGKHTGCRR
jgi:hypothetical protein